MSSGPNPLGHMGAKLFKTLGRFDIPPPARPLCCARDTDETFYYVYRSYREAEGISCARPLRTQASTKSPPETAPSFTKSASNNQGL